METIPTATKRSISTKVEFSAWVMLLLAVTMFTLTWFTLRQQRSALTQEVTRRGLALAQYMSTHSVDPFLTDDKLTLATLVADAMKNADVVYSLIVDRNNRVVAADRSERIGQAYVRPPGDYPLDRPAGRAWTWDHPQFGRVIDIGIPLILQGQSKIGEVHLGLSHSTIDRVVGRARRQLVAWSLGFAAAGLAVSIVLVTLMLRPVSALTRGAQEIGAGNLDYQIPVARRNELGKLAETFNGMARQLKVATAQAIEQEKIHKELQLAHQIQQTLLPKQVPQAKGFSFDALYRAAKEVGGDYYDFFQVDASHIGIAIADVCGKGVPAAMLMSMARSMLKSLAADSLSPARVVHELNRLIHDDLSGGLFITFFYAVLDIKQRTLTYTSAGHNPALIWRPGEQTLLSLNLEPPCLPLGLDDGKVFDRLAVEKKVQLAAQDVVVFYTDGVTEAVNPAGEEFGESGLNQLLQDLPAQAGAGEVVQALAASLTRFCDSMPQSDDIAVVAMKVAG